MTRTSSPNVLVLFAHPALERSTINRWLVEEAKTVENVTFHDLYELYPDFDVDIATEQALLRDHDVLVLQHPLFWYSVPALVKQWLDLVLEHGWAYGADGTQLRGKALAHAITIGGQAEAYSPGGHNHYTMGEFLRPFEQTARLCGMRFLDPFLVYGTLRMGPDDARTRARAYAGWLRDLGAAALNAPAAEADR